MQINDFKYIVNSEMSDDIFEKRAREARDLTIKRFGKVKGLYIPLYLSNFCDNICAYCGFRKDNKFPRKTLIFDEIKTELSKIFDKGFRNILLVSGECAGFKNIGYFVKAVELAKQIGFHSISVELGALSEEHCKLLVKAGAETFVLYQETYNRDTYKQVHLSGKKTDYDNRFEAPNRALAGGFRKVVFGFLCGLYSAEFEAVAMFEHIQNLRKKYWDREFGISLPRITKAEGVDYKKFAVNDKLYARILIAFRLAFPDITISLSTRESAVFRDGLMDICITNLSVESKTIPGGYDNTCKSEQNLEQFAITDKRTLLELKEVLQKKGYSIQLKDWEITLNEKEG